MADVKAQSLICAALRAFEPSIQIVGEEEETFDGDLGVDVSSLRRNLIDESSEFSPSAFSQQYTIKDLVVFVDPLDGTADFVNGHLESVTTLIGISFKGDPLIGILAHHYSGTKDEESLMFSPRVYFGIVGTSNMFCFDYSKVQNPADNPTLTIHGSLPEPDTQITLLLSRKGRPEENAPYFTQVEIGKYIMAGGAGFKILKILLGEGDAYAYFRGGLMSWDLLPGDVLLRCLGGRLTDMKGNELKYIMEDDYEKKGCIAGRTEKLFSQILQSVKSYQSTKEAQTQSEEKQMLWCIIMPWIVYLQAMISPLLLCQF
eukprot:TRINITY_DN8804_c0_g1_i45.p1 TRINITY_DN8804_c0_g1~~TRINITY_DN8804_c0_g1_i45.p1  ORF type:complete len:316 (+),score=19.59 TRINITY_DN8804_c0_g1_i45:269-1216(+)